MRSCSCDGSTVPITSPPLTRPSWRYTSPTWSTGGQMGAKLRGGILTLSRRAKAVHSPVRDALQLHVRDVVERARGQWARDSGRSAAGLDDEVRGPTKVAARGRAPYTVYIVSRGRNLWHELIVLSIERMMRRDLGESVGDAIGAELRVR